MIRNLLLSWILSALTVFAAAPQEPGPGYPAAAPESVGISSQALDELATIVRGFCAREKILGAEVLVIKDRKAVFHQGFGWSDRDDQLPMEPGTIFNLRSMTKSVVGAAAQILVDEGALELEAPVARYLPAFDTDSHRAITVDQVLTHRGGFPLTILTGLDEHPDLQTQACAVVEEELDSEPGSKFWYSDAGADVMGALVEAAAGEPLDAFVRRRLLEPLGMDDSFFSLPPDDPRWARVASVYMLMPSGDWVRFYKQEGKSLYPFAWGSQSLYGTPADYCRFLAMWADGGLAADGARVLSERAVASQIEAVSPMTALGSPMSMPTGFPGMQVWYGRMAVLYRPVDAEADAPSPVLSHSGSDGTIAWVWPEHDLIAAVFTQSRGSAGVLRLEADLHRLLFEPEINAGAPAEWQPLLGIYTPDEGSLAGREIEVLVYNGELAVDVPGQMVFALTEPDEDGWRAFQLDASVRLRFLPEPDGSVAAFEFVAGGEEQGVIRRGTAAAYRERQAAAAPAGLDLSRYTGVFNDVEGDAEVRMVVIDGQLVAEHPKVPIPLKFKGPDEGGFFTLEVNPAVKIRFTEDENGAVTGYDAHGGGEVLPRPKLRELEDE